MSYGPRRPLTKADLDQLAIELGNMPIDTAHVGWKPAVVANTIDGNEIVESDLFWWVRGKEYPKPTLRQLFESIGGKP